MILRENEELRILYIGCVISSYVFLDALIKSGAEICGVITKESSSFNSDFKDITPLCKMNNIPYIYVRNINDDEAIEFINECNPDIGYCLGWSQLINENIIKMFSKGIVGYHPAALPYNKGRHPIVWALALGLKTTASTFFMLEGKADTGDIISQRIVKINYEDNAETLMNKLLKCGSEQIVDATKGIEAGDIKRIHQDVTVGNYWRKRGVNDGKIDWRMSSSAIYNLVRALTKPYVGAHFMFGEQIIKVWSVREIICEDNQYNNIEPGKVINVKEMSYVVKTGDNLIEVLDSDYVELKPGDYL